MSPHLYEMMNRDPFESDRTLERVDTGQLARLEFICAVNATLLICHEIDSAYWREWELFRIPGGASMFVALHIPLIAIVLWGLILTAQPEPRLALVFFSIVRRRYRWRPGAFGISVHGQRNICDSLFIDFNRHILLDQSHAIDNDTPKLVDLGKRNLHLPTLVPTLP